MKLSFGTAKDLRSRAEILPQGPLWKSEAWNTTFPTKFGLHLYYRDPIDCLQAIMHNPLVTNHIQFHPFNSSDLQKVLCVYIPSG